jgi:Holliday junction resolvase RusA-like endonuclease
MRALTNKNGDPYLIHSNRGLGAWRKAIVDAISPLLEKLDGAVSVDCTFYLLKPKSVTRLLPWCRPDLDKLLRAVLDALQTAGAFKDDGQVVEIVAVKRYVEEGPGVLINIDTIKKEIV